MIFKNMFSSLFRICSEFAEEQANLSVVNFDSHADDSKLPDGDIIGLSGFSVMSSGPLQTAHVMIGIATREDTNLFRMVSLIDVLYQRLQPGKKLPVFDADNGSRIGTFTVMDGTRVLPVGGSPTIPLQYVMVVMGTDCFQAP